MSPDAPELDVLIDALRSDVPSDRERQRMRAQLLGAGVAVTAASSAAIAAADGAVLAGSAVEGAGFILGAKLTGLSLAAKIGWSAVAVVSATAVSLATPWQRESAPQTQARSRPAMAASNKPTPQTAIPALPVKPRPELTEQPAPPPVVTPNLVMPRSATRAQADEPKEVAQSEPMPTASVLREEAELLGRAVTALHQGDRAATSRWLTAHAQRFPQGALRGERARMQEKLETLTDPESDLGEQHE